MSKILSSEIKSPAPNATDPAALHRDLATAIIAFHEVCARQVGMSAAERKCLGVLWRMKVATAGELARATGLTTGAITGIADRLEKAGYVVRAPNPRDRRSVLLRPRQEAKLRRIVGPQFESLGAAMAELCSHYSAKELDLINDYLMRTTQVLRVETAKLKAHKKKPRAARTSEAQSLKLN